MDILAYPKPLVWSGVVYWIVVILRPDQHPANVYSRRHSGTTDMSAVYLKQSGFWHLSKHVTTAQFR